MQEELKEIIFCFSRDETVRELCHYQIHAPLLNKLQPTFPATAAMPPCAVQPFLGFATYFAPLCYVIKPRASLYTMSRLLFCQLWCRLNVLSGDANTLLPVCKLFEVLLLQMQPRLFMHLVNIGLQPLKVLFCFERLLILHSTLCSVDATLFAIVLTTCLKLLHSPQIAFSWIQLGFVGLLEVDQLLLLWDRVIGTYSGALGVAVLVRTALTTIAFSMLRFYGFERVCCGGRGDLCDADGASFQGEHVVQSLFTLFTIFSLAPWCVHYCIFLCVIALLAPPRSAQCTSEAEATMVLNECSRLRLVPLMQMLLFRDSRPT